MVDTAIWAFEPSEVSRLTGLDARTLKRWAADLCAGQWGGEFYSFRDLVGLRVLERLRHKHGVSRQELVRAARHLKEHSATPWSELRIGVSPHKKVVFCNPQTGRWETTDGSQQQVHPIAVDRVARETQQEVQRLRKRKAENIGRFSRQRGVMSNAECIAGTRIPVDVIADRLRENATTTSVIRAFPGLTRDDVEAVRREKLAG